MAEHDEQCAVIEWALYSRGKAPDLEWLFAIPNGAKLPYLRNKKGQRFSPQAEWLLREGLKPGVSDLFLPSAKGGFNGLFLEMKFGKNTVTPEQKMFMDAVEKNGYKVAVCYTAVDAIGVLCDYLGLDKETMF